jgi:hypothetical protein
MHDQLNRGPLWPRVRAWGKRRRRQTEDLAMKISASIATACFLLALQPPHSIAADNPSELIVGRWKIRQPANEQKLVETFEFAADGSGQLTKTSDQEDVKARISWNMTGIYGTACTVVIKYDNPPPGTQPLVLLFAFDGANTIVFEPVTSKIVFMDRMK